jgi:hypothetical protein
MPLTNKKRKLPCPSSPIGSPSTTSLTSDVTSKLQDKRLKLDQKETTGIFAQRRHVFASYELTQRLHDVEMKLGFSYELCDLIARYCSDRLLVVGGDESGDVELWQDGKCVALEDLGESKWSISMFFNHNYQVMMGCGRNKQNSFYDKLLQFCSPLAPKSPFEISLSNESSCSSMEQKFAKKKERPPTMDNSDDQGGCLSEVSPLHPSLSMFLECQSTNVIVGTNGRDGLIPRCYVFLDEQYNIGLRGNSTFLYDFECKELYDLESSSPPNLCRRGQPMVFVPGEHKNIDENKKETRTCYRVHRTLTSRGENVVTEIPKRTGRIYGFVYDSFSVVYYDLYLNQWITIPNSCIPQISKHTSHFYGMYLYMNVTHDFKFLIVTGGGQRGVHKFNLETHQWTTLLQDVNFQKPSEHWETLSNDIASSVVMNNNVLVFDPFHKHVLAININDGTVLHKRPFNISVDPPWNSTYFINPSNSNVPTDPTFDYHPRSFMSAFAF